MFCLNRKKILLATRKTEEDLREPNTRRDRSNSEKKSRKLNSGIRGYGNYLWILKSHKLHTYKSHIFQELNNSSLTYCLVLYLRYRNITRVATSFLKFQLNCFCSNALNINQYILFLSITIKIKNLELQVGGKN